MVSLLAFGENLSPKVLRRLLKENNLESEQRQARWYDNFLSKSSKVINTIMFMLVWGIWFFILLRFA